MHKIHKHLINRILQVCILSLILISCNKVVTTNDGSTNTGGTTTTTNPLNNDTLTDYPRIKFYTVMDYGNTKVTVKLNGNTTTIAKYYPSSKYIICNKGANTIILYYPDTTTNTVLSRQVDLIGGYYYSCFFYRVGYEWKLSVVRDDINVPSGINNAKIRLLDFRTQAYFDYTNTRVYNPGYDETTYYTRNFLDHETYSSYANFKEVSAGTYKIKVYNDSSTLKSRDSVVFKPGKIYSIVLLTPSSLLPDVALRNIYPDTYQHN